MSARSGPSDKLSGSRSPAESSILFSNRSSPRGSTGYETAGTTPALSISARSAGKRKRSTLREDVTRTVDIDEESNEDEALAMKLQLEEYDNEGPFAKRSKSNARIVDDSESELSEAADLLSDADDEPSVTRRGRKPAITRAPSTSRKVSRPVQKKAIASSSKTKLPSRAARSKARPSLSLAVEDSELSELSEMSEAESESDLFEESDGVSAEGSDSRDDLEELASEDSDAGVVATATHRSGGRTVNVQPRRRSGKPPRGRRYVPDPDIEPGLTRRQRERVKLERAHPGIKTMWTDLDASQIITPTAIEQPLSISRRLKPFQLEGVGWMIAQEKTRYKGGLLGDEMGMGKTIQAVSLIMSDYPKKEPTLVVVPPVALMQWTSEIKDYTDGKLKVLVYHGQNNKIRSMTVKQLKAYDVIMISYNSLESFYRKQTKGWSRGEDIVKEDSAIHAIHFHRIILDEAHFIKSRTTGVAKACFALDGEYKWCLSGTPVQNRIGEFFSLLRFLQVRPYADYFCKRCPCAILHWSVDEKHMCDQCKHSAIEHVSVFNQELLNPLTESDDPSERAEAMKKLHMVTARIMLRRMKRDYTSSMELPPKEVVIHNEFFGEIERDFSSSIMSNTTRQFDTYVSRGVMLNNYANIFGLIMQMRQIANHPDLLLKKQAGGAQNVLVCNICDEVAEEAIRSQCKHDFCRSCVKSYVQSVEETGGDADCPRCHVPLAIDFDQPEIEQDEEDVKKSSIVNRIRLDDWTSSTKIEMLVYDLWKVRSKKQTLKTIIFSQFTSMLHLIEWRLRRAGFNTVMLDGSMVSDVVVT